MGIDRVGVWAETATPKLDKSKKSLTAKSPL